MDLIFEIIFELIVEGSIEISSNKKISKFIRYPLIFLIVLFFGSIIFMLLYFGICGINKNLPMSLVLIALGLFFLIGSIIKFKKIYLEKKEDKENNKKIS